MGVVLRCYSFRNPILIIVAVSFFVTPLFFRGQVENFRLCWFSNNSRSETPNPDKSHIFGIVRTSAFSWCYPYRVYDIRMLSNCGKYKKTHFFAFFGVRPPKNSSGRRSENIDASGLPNSSSESWPPEDSENVVVFEILRFWTGVMAAQSQVIKKSVHLHWCFQA